MTAPAVLFLQRGGIAGYVLGVGAIFEFIVDAMPRAGNRTNPIGLTFRSISGIVVGWALCSFHGANPYFGALLGWGGAIAGAFLGLRVRLAAIQKLGALPAALVGDVVAVGLAILAVTRL